MARGWRHVWWLSWPASCRGVTGVPASRADDLRGIWVSRDAEPDAVAPLGLWDRRPVRVGDAAVRSTISFAVEAAEVGRRVAAFNQHFEAAQPPVRRENRFRTLAKVVS